MIGLIMRLLSFATLGGSLAGYTLTRHMLSGLVDIVALVVVCALMFTALLGGGLWGIYTILVYYGLQPAAALCAVIIVALAIMGALIWSICIRLRHLHALSTHKLNGDLPGISHISGMADAFLDGLFNPQDIHSSSSAKR